MRPDQELFSCSHLARRDQDCDMTIILLRDENETTYCYTRVSRRDREFRNSFRARKNEAYSHREFPGSRILVELYSAPPAEHFHFVPDEERMTWK